MSPHRSVLLVLPHVVTPHMTEADRRQQAIVDEFAFLDDWMLRFQQVIEHGEAMAPLPEALKTDDRLVRGCVADRGVENDRAIGEVVLLARGQDQQEQRCDSHDHSGVGASSPSPSR